MGMGIQLGRHCGGPSERKEGMSSMGTDKLKERGWGGHRAPVEDDPVDVVVGVPRECVVAGGGRGGLGIRQSNRFGAFGYEQRDRSNEVTGSKIPSSYLVLRSPEIYLGILETLPK